MKVCVCVCVRACMRAYVCVVCVCVWAYCCHVNHIHPCLSVAKVIIQRSDLGPYGDRLPVAHTCFNVLDLPPYPREDVMKQVLQ